MWGGAPDAFSLVWLCCGVEDTSRWVGAHGLHVTEWRTSGDLELVCTNLGEGAWCPHRRLFFET